MKILNVFNTLTLKQIFWKTNIFLKKLEYCFLVESIKIENASFPYKTAISEANVKTNKMVTTKWTCQEERSFASNYFIFLKILFQYKNFYKDLTCCTSNPNAHICTFCKRWSFIRRCFVSILKFESKQVCEIFVVNSLNYWFFKRFLLINLDKVHFFTQIDTRIRCPICVLSIFNWLVFLRVKIFYS